MIYAHGYAYQVLPTCLVIYKWDDFAKEYQIKDMMPTKTAMAKLPEIYQRHAVPLDPEFENKLSRLIL